MVNPAPKCLVLAGFGLNSEAELAYAFSLAGAESTIVHFSKIANGEKKLEDYQIFAIPGGWSYADEISSGKVLANKLKSSFRSQLEEFIAAGKAVVGICNGFQVLVKLGALPNLSGNFEQECTLTRNSSGKFEDRWIYMKPQLSVCKYFEGVPFIHCPVRHGEGRFIASNSILQQLESRGLIVAKYATEDLNEASGYPENPNGAQKNIAGICNPTGNVIGLMPHPECAVRKWLFPRWTAGISYEKHSLRFFSNIVEAAQEFV
ncbi:MAG: phosphoribosylformylglycinamidine synthase subunit PurQ [Candidatus Anstonellaceae archaeon]